MEPTSTPASSRKKEAGRRPEFDLPAIDPDQRRQMIATAAYYRAERRGFNGGDPNTDWYAAEKEVSQMLHEAAGDDENIVRLEALLTEWDTQFEDLKDRASKAKAQTRAEYHKQLQVVADKRALINEKLKDLRWHTGEVWNDLKNTIEHTWDEMCQETERLTARFKHEETTTEKKKGKSAK
jgi:hypothetical protein